ncbi:MAG: hypothetical protein ACTSRK_21065, partial [Promethearchaeota archaeon]
MRYKWGKYNWWIYCVIIAIVVLLILCYAYPNTDQDNARYILSAISQGLAAILALVFTITLVVAQMTRRYTAMDKIMLRPETLFLMIIFGLGVVTPLLVLKTELWGLGVNLSIALTVFCVFSLIAFLKGVNWVLKYEFGVNALYKEIMVAIESENKESVDIEELTEIGERAVTEAPENTVVTIIQSLSQIGKKCAEKGLGDETSWVVNSLRVIGVESVGRKFEEASFFAATGLKEIGVVAAKIGLTGVLSDPAPDAIDGLKDIGAKAAEKGFVKYNTTIRAVEGLKDVGMELKDKCLPVRGLWCLGVFVMEYLPEQVDRVIPNIKEMEKKIGRDLLMRWGENCMPDYPNLNASLEEFKRRYMNSNKKIYPKKLTLTDYGEFISVYSGCGTLSITDGAGEKSYECSFEAGQRIDGDIILLCHDLYPAFSFLFRFGMQAKKFEGKTKDGHLIRSNESKTSLLQINYPKSKNALYDQNLVLRLTELSINYSEEKCFEVRFGICNFKFDENDTIDKGKKSDKVILPIGEENIEISFKKVSDYDDKINRISTFKTIDVTCELVLKISNRSDLSKLITLIGDICFLLSVKNGTIISWIYYDIRQKNGKSIFRKHASKVTKAYQPLNIYYLNKTDAVQTKEFLESTYPHYLKYRDLFKLNCGVIDAFLAAKAETDFLETRAGKMALAIEFLKN